MKLLNPLRLLAKLNAPNQGVQEGSVYYDQTVHQPLFNDGEKWRWFGHIGVPLNLDGYVIPPGRQVVYFDVLRNEGVLVIEEDSQLVGMR